MGTRSGVAKGAASVKPKEKGVEAVPPATASIGSGFMIQSSSMRRISGSRTTAKPAELLS